MSDTVIKLENVSVSLGERLVLEDISLQVKKGHFLAIIGPNGAGKTTLFKVVLGLLQPCAGTVQIFGGTPEKLGKKRNRIAYVPQIRSVDMQFPLRVKDAVLMGRYARLGLFKSPTKTDRVIAEEMMEKVGIEDLAEKPIGKLSGGQIQRVFIARALAGEPDLLFLDEPTNGVDQLHTSHFYDLLKSLKSADMTILMISHDVGVIAGFVDTVACLNKRLIDHGKPKEILNGHALEAMYGCEAMFLHHCCGPNLVLDEGK